MTKKPKRKFHLLPNHYKIVGLCMMAAVFIPLILIHIGFQETAKEYLRLSAKAIFFSGWTLIAFSKDKDENSLLMTLRLYSATWAFFMAIS